MAVERDETLDWHRLFGLVLTDFFTDSPFTVEMESDLSLQQQFLDVIIVRRRRGRFAERLPDGMEELRQHNLVSFKSHREALDDRAMRELLHHWVAYHKLVSPAPARLLPDEQFRLFAVSARFPHNLSQQVPWQKVQDGVYDCQWAVDVVRVIVLGELPQEPHNAPLHLFSAAPKLVNYGQRHFRKRDETTSQLLGQLFEGYQREDMAMSYTMEDFKRWYAAQRYARMTPEEQQQLIEDAPVEKRLKGVTAQDILSYLSPEQLQHLREQLTAESPEKPRKPRRKK